MTESNWNDEARRAANYFSNNHFEAHRGAKSWGSLGMSVVFGNDGYDTDDKAKREVELVRTALAYLGITEMGFGVCDENGYTWALLARTDRHKGLNNLVWLAREHAEADAPGVPIGEAELEDIINRLGWELVEPGTDDSVSRAAQRRIAETSIDDIGTPPPSIN